MLILNWIIKHAKGKWNTRWGNIKEAYSEENPFSMLRSMCLGV